ncbi:MAG: polysaccharide biosynthesis tyrosine autokinase [Planctomycetota bacterium]
MSMHDNEPRSSPSVNASPPAMGHTGQPPTETMRTSIFLPPMLQGLDQGPQIPSALNAAPTATTLMKAFQRRWPLAIGAGLLAAAFSAAAIYVLFPARFATYFCVKVSSNKNVGVMGDRGEDADFNVFKAGQAALVKNRNVISRALDQQIKGRYIKDLGIVRSKGDPVEWLQAALKTDFLKAPEIMTATLTADEAEELTLLLNALANSLIEENRIIEDTKHNTQIELTQSRARQLQAEIDLKRKVLNQRTGALGPNPQAINKKLDQIEQEFRDTKKLLRDKQSDLYGLRSRIEQLTKRIQSPESFPVSESTLNDFLRTEPDAMILLKQVQQAKNDYADTVRITQDSGSPQARRFLDQVDLRERAFDSYRRKKLPELTAKVREKMASDGAQELNKLNDDEVALQKQVEHLTGIADNLETELQRFRPQNMPVDLLALQSDIDSLEQAMQKIAQNIQFMKINVPPAKVSLLQEAIEPHSRDTSRQTKLVGAGSIGMFLLTVLGISFLEFRSRKITSTDEVKRGLGLTVIGTVPTLPEKARSPIAQNKLDAYWQNQLMESVDTIRTMLLHSSRANNTRVIMVTSAVGGEGKTSLSSQLAASLARAWKKTLLIDGDLRNPTAHQLFDVPQDPGFSEVLRGELSATEAVRSTPLSRLWILPAGHWDSHAVQVLAQDNVRTILEELKQQYDFIIFDSCPILPVADSLLLGQNVDGVLMTVMNDVSRSPAVHAAHQRLEGLGIKILGAVVIGTKNELGPLGYKYAYQARP